jgi:hypothetical protein
MISGAANTVRVRVAALSDFVIMKAHALEGATSMRGDISTAALLSAL